MNFLDKKGKVSQSAVNQLSGITTQSEFSERFQVVL